MYFFWLYKCESFQRRSIINFLLKTWAKWLHALSVYNSNLFKYILSYILDIDIEALCTEVPLRPNSASIQAITLKWNEIKAEAQTHVFALTHTQGQGVIQLSEFNAMCWTIAYITDKVHTLKPLALTYITVECCQVKTNLSLMLQYSASTSIQRSCMQE